MLILCQGTCFVVLFAPLKQRSSTLQFIGIREREIHDTKAEVKATKCNTIHKIDNKSSEVGEVKYLLESINTRIEQL